MSVDGTRDMIIFNTHQELNLSFAIHRDIEDTMDIRFVRMRWAQSTCVVECLIFILTSKLMITKSLCLNGMSLGLTGHEALGRAAHGPARNVQSASNIYTVR